jgi:SpoVK/Ycf46/Vps4 family AAA+-type ATPase
MHSKNKNEEYLHMVITGAPGGGKTTVSKIIGNIYKNMDILSKNGIFRIAGRDDLVGQYLGETAIKTKKLLTSCLGGVLFIDEAYSLGPGQKDKDSYSKECVDTLCGFLSEHKNDFCCIIAGYEEEIKKCFFAINPGLERRFPWVHKIDVYDEEDLTKIFLKLIKKINWNLHSDVDVKYLIEFFKNNKEYFKNSGGDIENFISKIKMCHSLRVFSLDKEFKFILTDYDFKKALDNIKKHRFKNEEKPTYINYYI